MYCTSNILSKIKLLGFNTQIFNWVEKNICLNQTGVAVEKNRVVQESRVWVVKLYLVIYAQYFPLRFLYDSTKNAI